MALVYFPDIAQQRIGHYRLAKMILGLQVKSLTNMKMYISRYYKLLAVDFPGPFCCNCGWCFMASRLQHGHASLLQSPQREPSLGPESLPSPSVRQHQVSQTTSDVGNIELVSHDAF